MGRRFDLDGVLHLLGNPTPNAKCSLCGVHVLGPRYERLTRWTSFPHRATCKASLDVQIGNLADAYAEVGRRLITVREVDMAELAEAVQAAQKAADGDSNDAEIEALQDLAEQACAILGVQW